MNRPANSDFENMKSKTPLHVFGMLALLFVVAFGFNGCNEIEDTVAVVYVQNSLGAPVQGAEVRLFAVGSVNQTVIGELRFDTTQVTNAAGSVSFNFSSTTSKDRPVLPFWTSKPPKVRSKASASSRLKRS